MLAVAQNIPSGSPIEHVVRRYKIILNCFNFVGKLQVVIHRVKNGHVNFLEDSVQRGNVIYLPRCDLRRGNNHVLPDILNHTLFLSDSVVCK